MKFRSVLVTGATGFVGRRVARAFKGQKGMNLSLCGGPSCVVGPDYVALDLIDQNSVAKVVQSTAPDLVVHLAGQASVGHSVEAASETWITNFLGSYHLANSIREYTPNATILFVSSAEVYGASFNQGVMDESAAVAPLSVYAKSKFAAECMFADILPRSCQLIVVRPSNHSGSDQDVRFVLPSFARQIAEIELGLKEPTLSVGNLNVGRDFMNVDDVVSTYFSLLRKAPGLGARELFNVCSGSTVMISELLQKLLRLAKVEISVEVNPEKFRISDVEKTLISNRRLVENGISLAVPAGIEMLRSILDYQRLAVRSE